MAFTKTRIWRGGVAGTGSLRQEEDDLAHSTEPQGEPPVDRCADAAAEVEASWERAARQHSAQAPHFDPDEHTPPFAITRLWPIEQLFPEEHGARTAPPAEPAWAAPSSTEGTLKLWWRGLRARTMPVDAAPARGPMLQRIAVGLLCAACLLAAWYVIPRARGPLTPVHALSPPALPEPPAALLRMPPRALVAPEADAQPVRQGASLPPGLERSAIDALVAGDVARAQQLYQRLAKAAPHEPAFRQALRVIESQAAAPR